MSSDSSTWQDALAARDDLTQYGDNAVGLFSLAIRFALDDIHTVASESVTDGSDDKKCDLIYIDREEGIAIVAQCYWAKANKKSAPANKASDLNTAVAWLLQRPINQLPSRLRSPAQELRDAIKAGDIRRFEAWYVHNLPEHKNVRNELGTVEQTASTLLNALNPPKKITSTASEIGKNKLAEWYRETLSPILVNEEIEFDITDGFSVEKEEDLLEYFRHRGSTFLLVSAISACIEVFHGKKVANPVRLSFGPNASPATAMENWREVVDIVSPFAQQLLGALNDGLKSADRAAKVINTFRSLVQATAAANKHIYGKFSKLLVPSK